MLFTYSNGEIVDLKAEQYTDGPIILDNRHGDHPLNLADASLQETSQDKVSRVQLDSQCYAIEAVILLFVVSVFGQLGRCLDCCSRRCMTRRLSPVSTRNIQLGF